MRSYRSTIGGAFSATGTMLVGVGVVPQIADGTPSKVLMWISLVGFAMQATGTFLGHLYSADKKAVRQMISDSNGEADTTFVKKTDLNGEGKIKTHD